MTEAQGDALLTALGNLAVVVGELHSMLFVLVLGVGLIAGILLAHITVKVFVSRLVLVLGLGLACRSASAQDCPECLTELQTIANESTLSRVTLDHMRQEQDDQAAALAYEIETASFNQTQILNAMLTESGYQTAGLMTLSEAAVEDGGAAAVEHVPGADTATYTLDPGQTAVPDLRATAGVNFDYLGGSGGWWHNLIVPTMPELGRQPSVDLGTIDFTITIPLVNISKPIHWPLVYDLSTIHLGSMYLPESRRWLVWCSYVAMCGLALSIARRDLLA